MSKVFIEESTLTAIGDAIRAKRNTTELIAPLNMPAAIEGITSGGNEELTVISGKGNNKFYKNAWNDQLKYFTTKDITDCTSMFYQSDELTNIPFEINCKENSPISLSSMFSGCKSLTSIPKINNCRFSGMGSFFYECNKLREIPEDIDTWFDWSYADTSAASKGNLFYCCYALKKVPMKLLECKYNSNSYSSVYLYNGFNSCFSLGELVDLPLPIHVSGFTSNIFYSTFYNCSRLKNITFKTDENGQPQKVKWAKQTIDLTSSVFGYGINCMSHNPDFTNAKLVNDDVTYQALKNDPDWFAKSADYARYNHDSAVATINTLPDTSEFLAEKGGTNTIKFKGALGAKTDGGAINTLTEAEIAVAAAKGWTVTIS